MSNLLRGIGSLALHNNGEMRKRESLAGTPVLDVALSGNKVDAPRVESASSAATRRRALASQVIRLAGTGADVLRTLEAQAFEIGWERGVR